MRVEKALVVGATVDGDMNIEFEDGSLGLVLEKEIGGETKKNKAFNMIGSKINVIKHEENFSRVKAMEMNQKDVKNLKIGQKISVTPIIIMEGFMVVDAYGHELYQKVKDISLNYISDLNDNFSIDDNISAIVQSIEPFRISIKEAEEESIKQSIKLYKNGKDWLAEVVAHTSMGTFCSLPGGSQVLCYNVEWARKPRKGDKVILEIKKIDYEEGKMWGAIKKYVKKV